MMHAVAAIFLSVCAWLIALCFCTVFQPLYVIQLMILAPFIISGGVLAIYAVQVSVAVLRRVLKLRHASGQGAPVP